MLNKYELSFRSRLQPRPESSYSWQKLAQTPNSHSMCVYLAHLILEDYSVNPAGNWVPVLRTDIPRWGRVRGS